MIRSVVWVFWAVVVGFLGGLAALSWWWDRDARKRGATPLSGGAMQRARWSRRLEVERQLSVVLTKGATPRTQDSVRDAWTGKTDQ